MKKIIILLVLQSFFLRINSQVAEKEGYVAIEMENTLSPLGQWIKVQDGDLNFNPTASGGAHLEFNGNTTGGGSPNSPLEYTFTITTAGTYQLMVKGSRRNLDAPNDHCNDCYLRVTGDYTSGNNHPTDLLQTTDLKLFGAQPFPNWGWAKALEHNGSAPKARYNFKAGETYKVIISGRSKRYNPDFVLLFNTAIYTQDEAIASLSPSSFNSLAVGDYKKVGEVSVFPNPCQDFINVSNVKPGSQVKLFNLFGSELAINSVEVNNNSLSIPTASLSAGVYFVVINGYTMKLIKK
jgi:hypothetical protein